MGFKKKIYIYIYIYISFYEKSNIKLLLNIRVSGKWVYILVLSIKYTSYWKKYGLNGKNNSKFIEKKMVRRRVKKRIWKFGRRVG